MNRRPSVRAVLFDAGNTLLEIDYPLLTAQIGARGHDVDEASVIAAERRARLRLDVCGARSVGMDAVLFDPGGVWDRSDCLRAGGLAAAIELALG